MWTRTMVIDSNASQRAETPPDSMTSGGCSVGERVFWAAKTVN